MIQLNYKYNRPKRDRQMYFWPPAVGDRQMERSLWPQKKGILHLHVQPLQSGDCWNFILGSSNCMTQQRVCLFLHPQFRYTLRILPPHFIRVLVSFNGLFTLSDCWADTETDNMAEAIIGLWQQLYCRYVKSGSLHSAFGTKNGKSIRRNPCTTIDVGVVVVIVEVWTVFKHSICTDVFLSFLSYLYLLISSRNHQNNKSETANLICDV